MSNVNQPRQASNPQVTVHPYLDALELIFPPHITLDQRQTLKTFGPLPPCCDEDGVVRGWRLVVLNQQSKHQLLRLDPIAQQLKGVVSRFDLALDQNVVTKDKIERMAILKWRPKGPMRDVGEGRSKTTYWMMPELKQPRDLVAYDDKLSKITNEPCVHLELRFLRAKVIKRQGIRRVSDLIHINPQNLYNRHVGWSDAGEKYLQKVLRNVVNEDRKMYEGKETSQFTDTYRSWKRDRVRYILRVTHHDTTQRRKDIVGEARRVDPPFAIPTSLSWAEDAHSIGDKVAYTSPHFQKTQCFQ